MESYQAEYEKKIRTVMRNCTNYMQAIVDKAEEEDRDLTKEEMRDFDEKKAIYDEKKKELENFLNNRGNHMGSKIKNLSGLSTVAPTTETGGRALDTEGKVRLFESGEKMADQYDGDISLGQFLRAAIHKPANDMERQAIQRSVGSSGYELPTHVAAEVIDRLRAANPLNALGARNVSIEGLDGTKYVTIENDMQAVWHEELNEEAFSDPTFGSKTLVPKTVMALTEISRELLQDSANIEMALSTAFVGAINDAILEATFSGGGTHGPAGLNTMVTQTESYPNAGSPDWSHFVAASKTLYDNNVPAGGRAFAYSPDIWETLALIQDSNDRYQDAPSFIRDIPSITSSGVPAGESYVGDFSNLVYGWRLQIGLEQHAGGKFMQKYAQAWLATARLDLAVFRPSALVRIEEAAP